MASDNPGFVDTENTSAGRWEAQGDVHTTPRIASDEGEGGGVEAGGGGEEASLTTPTAPAATPHTTGLTDANTLTEENTATPPGPVRPEVTSSSDSPAGPTSHPAASESTTPTASDRAEKEEQSPVSEVSEEPTGALAMLSTTASADETEGGLSTGDGPVANGGAKAKAKAVDDAEGGAGGGGAMGPREATRALRNAVGVGVVFMVHFTATLGVTHLQSSVNKAQGLGTSALAAQYTGLVLSSLLLSVFVISKLGCKWTIVVAILCNVPYMLAQMLPRIYTLVPAAFLMGLAVAPLWSAKCTYLCVIAEARAAITGRPLSAVRDHVIGLFFMVFLLSMVWGNLVSSLVLSHGEGPRNASGSALCGVDYCPNSAAVAENPNLERPPQEKITLIIGIYVGFMLLGALIAATLVDSLNRYRGVSRGGATSASSTPTTVGLLTATLGLHTKKEMLLLIPLSLWLGVDYAFVEAEYTASFVACAWGIQNIGYVIIVYGVCNSALALCTGWLVARAGRRLVLCAAAVAHMALMAGTLAWRPSPDHPALFFVVAGLWGALDGHWAVQLNSLYAILFPNMEEAAYSNFRLWQSIGFVIAFSYSHYLCTIYKLYVVMALLVVGVAGYLGIEWTRPHKAKLIDG